MRHLAVVVGLLVALFGGARLSLAKAEPEYPAKLPDGVYVSDRAAVLSLNDVTTLNKAAAEIERTSHVPIYVVTIRSLADMTGGALVPPAGAPAEPAVTVEAYAMGLFNHWGVGSARDNRGILLLYANDDHRARIQLGAAWPKSQEAVTQRIMDTVIVPEIKRSAYGTGLLAGVKQLGVMIAEADAAKGVSGAGTTAGGAAAEGSGASAPAPAAATPAPRPARHGDLAPTETVQTVQISFAMLGLLAGGAVVLLALVVVVFLSLRRRQSVGRGADSYGPQD